MTSFTLIALTWNTIMCIYIYIYAFSFFHPFLLRDVDPVVFAIRRGDIEAVNDLATSSSHRLLKENKDGWTPLHDAAYCGQTECLKILLRGMVPIQSWCLLSEKKSFHC